MFGLLTGWVPVVTVIVGLLAAGVVLWHAGEVGPVGLVATGGAVGVLLLAALVLALDWL